MGNAVGSLSEVQHTIVIGTLLGDGAMRCKTNALLEINHSSHQQRYVLWKYEHLFERRVSISERGVPQHAAV